LKKATATYMRVLGIAINTILEPLVIVYIASLREVSQTKNPHSIMIVKRMPADMWFTIQGAIKDKPLSESLESVRNTMSKKIASM